MESCLNRIDYRMTLDSFIESEYFSKKTRERISGKRRIRLSLIFSALFLLGIGLRIFFAVENPGGSGQFFIVFADTLIAASAILLVIKIFSVIEKRKRTRLFGIRELDKKPCYMELHEEFFLYSVDGAEIKHPYEKISAVRDTEKTLTILANDGAICISVPKKRIDGDAFEKFSTTLCEKVENFAAID